MPFGCSIPYQPLCLSFPSLIRRIEQTGRYRFSGCLLGIFPTSSHIFKRYRLLAFSGPGTQKGPGNELVIDSGAATGLVDQSLSISSQMIFAASTSNAVQRLIFALLSKPASFAGYESCHSQGQTGFGHGFHGQGSVLWMLRFIFQPPFKCIATGKYETLKPSHFDNSRAVDRSVFLN